MTDIGKKHEPFVGYLLYFLTLPMQFFVLFLKLPIEFGFGKIGSHQHGDSGYEQQQEHYKHQQKRLLIVILCQVMVYPVVQFVQIMGLPFKFARLHQQLGGIILGNKRGLQQRVALIGTMGQDVFSQLQNLISTSGIGAGCFQLAFAHHFYSAPCRRQCVHARHPYALVQTMFFQRLYHALGHNVAMSKDKVEVLAGLQQAVHTSFGVLRGPIGGNGSNKNEPRMLFQCLDKPFMALLGRGRFRQST